MQADLHEGLLPDSDVRKRIAELLPRLRPTGLFPNDANVARPPPLPESIAKRTNTKKDKRNPTVPKGKDTKAYFNTIREVGNHVRDHNELHANNPKMQYRWYGPEVDDKERTETLMRIVDDLAPGILGKMYGATTYDKIHRSKPHHLQLLVLECSLDPNFDPLTQGVRNFPTRKVVGTKLTSKRKVCLEAVKREARKGREDSIILEELGGSSRGSPVECGDSTNIDGSMNIEREWNTRNGTAVSVVDDLPRDVVQQYMPDRADDDKLGPADIHTRAVTFTDTPVSLYHTRNTDLETRRIVQNDGVDSRLEDRRHMNPNTYDAAADDIGIRGTLNVGVANAPNSGRPKTAVQGEGEEHASYKDISHRRSCSKASLHASLASRVRANPLVRGKGKKGDISKSRVHRDRVRSTQRNNGSNYVDRAAGQSSASPKKKHSSSAKRTKEAGKDHEEDDESTSFAEYIAWKASQKAKGRAHAGTAATRRNTSSKLQKKKSRSYEELHTSEDSV